MRISIIGGTGDLGRGLALRLCSGREIIIGSRDQKKARRYAKLYREISGCDDINGTSNAMAAGTSDHIVLTVPASSLGPLLEELSETIKEGSMVVSPVVPMVKRGGLLHYSPFDVKGRTMSAAEFIKMALRHVDVIAAFHTIPAKILGDPSVKGFSYDVLVAADARDSFKKFVEIFSPIEGLRYLYAGPLETARQVEALVPLLLNVGTNNGMKYPSMRVV